MVQCQKLRHWIRIWCWCNNLCTAGRSLSPITGGESIDDECSPLGIGFGLQILVQNMTLCNIKCLSDNEYKRKFTFEENPTFYWRPCFETLFSTLGNGKFAYTNCSLTHIYRILCRTKLYWNQLFSCSAVVCHPQLKGKGTLETKFNIACRIYQILNRLWVRWVLVELKR